jgi:N utilization substance protein B
VEQYDANLRLVQQFTLNWDIERIAMVDNLIMTTAITELTSFPDIPVKVTLDEYIEIAKYYSTPGSNTFINGVLDRVVETLTAEGRIKKEGRGLV